MMGSGVRWMVMVAVVCGGVGEARQVVQSEVGTVDTPEDTPQHHSNRNDINNNVSLRRTGIRWWTLPLAPHGHRHSSASASQGVVTSRPSLLHYLVPDALHASPSLTGTPQALPHAPSPSQMPPPPSGNTRAPGPVENALTLHSAALPFPSLENVNSNTLLKYLDDKNRVDHMNIEGDKMISAKQTVPSRARFFPSRRKRDVSQMAVHSDSFTTHDTPRQDFNAVEVNQQEDVITSPVPIFSLRSNIYYPQYYDYPYSIVYPDRVTSSTSLPIFFPTASPPPSSTYPSDIPSSSTGMLGPDFNTTDVIPTTLPPFDTDTRVSIVVPCRGPCQVPAGDVCVTNSACLFERHAVRINTKKEEQPTTPANQTGT